MLAKKLRAAEHHYASILPSALFTQPALIFDFTKNNPEIQNLDVTDTAAFERYVSTELASANAVLGAGGYGEDRDVYRSSLFMADGEARSVHLAVDLWVAAGTPVIAPLDATVHSFQDNNHLLDYGPTIILEHTLEGTTFFTLYGHLGRSSLEGLMEGKKIPRGTHFATIGKSTENGHWPPHLHFQIISDMLGKNGDFPGVARPSEKEKYLALCPNPNLILRIPTLP